MAAIGGNAPPPGIPQPKTTADVDPDNQCAISTHGHLYAGHGHSGGHCARGLNDAQKAQGSCGGLPATCINFGRVVLRNSDSALPPAAPLAGAKLAVRASGQGLDTMLDIALKVHATRSALKSPAAGSDAAVPVTFVVTGHAQPIPYVVRRAVPGHWGPAGEPEHVVAATRIALKELVPAGVQDSALYVWALAGDQLSTPVRVALP